MSIFFACFAARTIGSFEVLTWLCNVQDVNLEPALRLSDLTNWNRSDPNNSIYYFCWPLSLSCLAFTCAIIKYWSTSMITFNQCHLVWVGYPSERCMHVNGLRRIVCSDAYRTLKPIFEEWNANEKMHPSVQHFHLHFN